MWHSDYLTEHLNLMHRCGRAEIAAAQGLYIPNNPTGKGQNPPQTLIPLNLAKPFSSNSNFSLTLIIYFDPEK